MTAIAVAAAMTSLYAGRLTFTAENRSVLYLRIKYSIEIHQLLLYRLLSSEK